MPGEEAVLPAMIVPLPDEPLYSVLARQYRHLGLHSIRRFRLWVFGNPNTTTAIDFPQNLELLCTRIGRPPLNDVDYVIRHHTLAPIWAPFLQPHKLQTLLEIMRSGGSVPWGRQYGATPRPMSLRYCPQCALHDRRTWGEAYWHRVHQVPGITACPQHVAGLLSIADRSSGDHYIAAEDAVPEGGTVTAPRSVGAVELRLAEDVAWLLQHWTPSYDGLTQTRFDQILTDSDATDPYGRARYALYEAFRAAYSSDVFRTLSWDLSTSTKFQTFQRQVRGKATFSPDPTRQLLFIHFLGYSLREFLRVKSMSQPRPFGTGPWPCLNPVAAHRNSDKVATVKIRYQTRRTKLSGEFSCEDCGFTYRRRGPDLTPEDRFRFDDILQFGGAWEQEFRTLWTNPLTKRTDIAAHLGIGADVQIYVAAHLGLPLHTHTRPLRAKPWHATLKQMWSNPGIGLEKMAQQLGISLGTMKHHAILLGLPYPRPDAPYTSTPAYISRSATPSDIGLHRAQWLELIEANPTVTRTELYATGTYRWLAKKDRAWVEEHLPPVNVARAQVIDWRARDSHCARQIPNIVETLKTRDSIPRRISQKRICNAIDSGFSHVQDYLTRLPKTRALVEELAESDVDFAIRRIEWAFSVSTQTGEQAPDREVIENLKRLKGFRHPDAQCIFRRLYEV